MKILFLQTNYPAFLNNFYKKSRKWKDLSYEELMKTWAEKWFGTADFYSKHLKQFGWDGKEIIINDWNSQSKWAKENGLKIKKEELPLTGFLPPMLKNLIGAQRWIPKILLEQVKKFKPDVIYSHNVSIFLPNDLKKIKKYTKLLIGQIASPLPINKTPLYEYDLIITSFPHFVEKFRNLGINSEYLRWCVEKSIPEKIGKKKKIYDVTYVGGFTPHHSKGNKELEELAKEVKVDFWGYGEKTLLPTSPIRQNFHGQAWGKEMYEIFAKSKIVINRHINTAGNYANNMRMFEATAMGALLVTDSKKNMDEFFRAGEEVITYKDSSDLIEKVKYYLKHDKEKQKIAKAGQKRTLEDHAYGVRMKRLDEILKKYLKKPD
jgi:glycosyltransferase involved in cell wall biosynthesis